MGAILECTGIPIHRKQKEVYEMIDEKVKYIRIYCILKGHCHEMVVEIRPWSSV
jgi:hypothetical protein